jgi:RNA-directed DNA polymerase
MQLKLHRWASDDATRRFGDLFNLVYDPAFLVHAWERVTGNAGARTAGVDGVTVAHIETRVGVHVFLDQVRDLLKSGEYRPSPVRQVKIPKGGGKLRSLGIPTVLDRVVQAACKAVLEPVFEADSSRARTGSAPIDARMTRSPRSTTSPPGRSITTGCWRPTSQRVSTRSTTSL